ncbi:hypothetical protein D3C76_888440 [compost metagenome]
MVAGAVERSDRRGGEAAGRVHPAVEQDQLRLFVLRVAGGEDLPPGVLGVAEDRAHEVHLRIGAGGRAALGRGGRGRLAGVHLADDVAEDLHRVLAHQQADHHDDGDAAEAQAASADAPAASGEAAAGAGFATRIDHVVAAPSFLPEHDGSSSRKR